MIKNKPSINGKHPNGPKSADLAKNGFCFMLASRNNRRIIINIPTTINIILNVYLFQKYTR